LAHRLAFGIQGCGFWSWAKKWNWTSRGNQTQAEVIEIEGMAKYAS
jgi:hypothetical protein